MRSKLYFLTLTLLIVIITLIFVTCNKNVEPNQPPVKPTINNSSGVPSHASLNISTTPTLSWNCSDPDGDELTFDVYFGKSSTPPIVSSHVAIKSFSPDTLEYNTKYFWRVVAKDQEGDATSSDVWNFVTISESSPDIPLLIIPTNYSVFSDSTPLFVWNQAARAVLYEIIVDNDSGFISHEISENNLNDTIYTSSTALSDDTYYWKVRAQNNSGTWGSWSEIWSLNINTNVVEEPCDIEITSPTSSDIFDENYSTTIVWNKSGDCGDSVKLELYKDSTMICMITSTTPNNGSYSWLADDCGAGTGSDYNIKISDIVSGKYDYSEYFTINDEEVTCSITVTSPIASSNLNEGNNTTITWNKSGDCGDSVELELFKDSSKICTITSATPNNGSFSWLVDDCDVGAGTDYNIRLTDLTSSKYYLSDNFTINVDVGLCEYTMVLPDSFSIWDKNSTKIVTWNSSGDCHDLLGISLYKGDLRLAQIAHHFHTPNTGSFNWIVNDYNHGTGSDYRIIAGYGGINDFSDYFTINADIEPCIFTVTNPTSSSVFDEGETITISWNSEGDCREILGIDLYKGDERLSAIAPSNIPNNGSYTWMVDDYYNGSSSEYRFKVGYEDESNFSDYFTIIADVEPCVITVVSPDSLSVWDRNATNTIIWTATGECGDYVKIDLNEYVFTSCTINPSAPNTGSYSWDWVFEDCARRDGSHYRILITDLTTGKRDFGDDFTVFAYNEKTFYTIADTYVWTYYNPPNNYGNDPVIYTGNYGGSFRGFIKFDISSLPSSANIEKATLVMRVSTISQSIVDSSVTSVMVSQVLNLDWTEAGITYSNSPRTFRDLMEQDMNFKDYVPYFWDVTSAVQAWHTGTEPNYGLTIKASDSVSTWGMFASKEGNQFGGPDSGPLLLIEYSN